MREAYWGSARLIAEDGRPISCRYYILVRTCPPPVNGESYGVRITREETGETAVVPDLTMLPSRIHALADQLIRCGVTPCALGDVVDDWL